MTSRAGSEVQTMWLAVEGVVGAGKTTTSSLIGELTGLAVANERSERHPFLCDYYDDPARLALETELAFMLIQLRELKSAVPSSGLVSDFAPAKNLVFARLHSSADDIALLEAVEGRLWRAFGHPDLAIYLDVPTEICLRRIRERGREYEQRLTVEDLDRIKEGYRSSLGSLGAEVRTLELSGREPPDEVARRSMAIAGLG